MTGFRLSVIDYKHIFAVNIMDNKLLLSSFLIVYFPFSIYLIYHMHFHKTIWEIMNPRYEERLVKKKLRLTSEVPVC